MEEFIMCINRNVFSSPQFLMMSSDAQSTYAKLYGVSDREGIAMLYHVLRDIGPKMFIFDELLKSGLVWAMNEVYCFLPDLYTSNKKSRNSSYNHRKINVEANLLLFEMYPILIERMDKNDISFYRHRGIVFSNNHVLHVEGTYTCNEEIVDAEMHKLPSPHSSDEYIYNKLYAVGFEGQPTKNNLAFLRELTEEWSYPTVIGALRITRRNGKKSLKYTEGCIANIEKDGGMRKYDDDDYVDPERCLDEMYSNLEQFGKSGNTYLGDYEKNEDAYRWAIKDLARYFTDKEIRESLRLISAFQLYGVRYLYSALFSRVFETMDHMTTDDMCIKVKEKIEYYADAYPWIPHE